MFLPANPSDESPSGATGPAGRAAGAAGDSDATGGVATGRAAVDSRGRHIEILDHAWVMEDRGRRKVGTLTDPSDTSFTDLPPADLADGRSARRAAFEVWAEHVRTKVRHGANWETTYQPRRPIQTWFAMLGATVVGGSALASVLIWAGRDPQVRHQPGIVGGIVSLAGVAVLLWIAWATLSSAVRYWLTRFGSYARVDARGVTLGKGSERVDASEIASARYFPLLRATHVVLRSGRGHWVHRESGPLVRLDLVLAALPGGPTADV